MLGTDGRLYDSDFDFDEDGKLNAYEYSVMDDLVFGHEDTCTSDETELEDDLLLAGLNETGIMLTDWSLQYFGIKESTNSRRLVTGLIGGFGLNTLKLKIL